MGIKRLTGYVLNNDEVARSWDGGFRLHDTRLVVDGNALIYRLLEDGAASRDLRCGGQYAEFYYSTFDFFAELLRHNVQPLVVLDGMSAEEKKETLRERTAESARSLKALSECRVHQIEADGVATRTVKPPWTSLVFMEVLVDCGIALYRADGEADNVISAIAYHWRCPILSGDSDFFICDLPGGFIHLSRLNLNHPCASSMPVLYRQELFVEALSNVRALAGISEETINVLLPLAASLCGNDFVRQAGVQSLYSHAAGRHPLVQALHWLTTKLQVGDLETGLWRLSTVGIAEHVCDGIRHSIRMYAPSASEIRALALRCLSMERFAVPMKDDLPAAWEGVAAAAASLANPGDGAVAPLEIPGWLSEAYHLGLFQADLTGCFFGFQRIKVFMQSFPHSPVSLVDKPLRAILLTMVTSSPASFVKEMVRSRGSCAIQDVRLLAACELPGYGAVPSVRASWDLSVEKRQKILLLASHSWTSRVRSLPPAFQLLVASLRYVWCQVRSLRDMPQIRARHLQVLLVGIVNACGGDVTGRPLLFHDDVVRRQKDLLLLWCGQPHGRRARRQDAEPCEIARPYDGFVDPKATHAFSAWQRSLLALLMLNWTLQLPLPLIRFGKLYDGVKCYSLFDDACMVDVFQATEHRKLAESLWQVITDELEGFSEAAAVGGHGNGSGSEKRQRKKHQAQVKDTAQVSRDAALANRFAGLRLE